VAFEAAWVELGSVPKNNRNSLSSRIFSFGTVSEILSVGLPRTSAGWPRVWSLDPHVASAGVERGFEDYNKASPKPKQLLAKFMI